MNCYQGRAVWGGGFLPDRHRSTSTPTNIFDYVYNLLIFNEVFQFIYDLRLLTQHEYHIVIQSDTNRDLGMIIAEQLPMVTT